MVTVTRINKIVESFEFFQMYYLEVFLKFNKNISKKYSNLHSYLSLDKNSEHHTLFVLDNEGLELHYEIDDFGVKKLTSAEDIVYHIMKERDLKINLLQQICNIIEQEEEFIDFKLPILLLAAR